MPNSNCLKFFVGLSLTAALILPSSIFFFLTPHFEKLMLANTEKEAERVCSYMISRFITGSSAATEADIARQLLQSEAEIKSNFQIKAFRFFSKTGQTLYSSGSADIGKINQNNYFSEIVGKGKTFSRLVQAGGTTLDGEVVPVAMVQTYVPVMEKDVFNGAFEIYYDITAIKAGFHNMMTKVYWGIGIIATSMTLLISWSYCRARSVMTEKKRLYEEKDKNFQIEVFFNKLFQLSLVKTSLAEILQIFICHLTSFPGMHLKQQGVVFLVNKKSKELELTAQCGFDNDMLSSCRKELFGPRTCLRKTEYGECFLGRIVDNDDASQPDSIPVQDHYCFPIHSSTGEFLGVFTIYPKKGEGQYERAEKIFLAVANLLAGIIERKQIEEKLHDISITDELTGLFNRRGFRTLAQQELDLAERQKETMAVFYIDLDGLKQINDQHGHNAGDQAIKDTADILKDTFRAADIIARIGGDEFAVFGSFSPQTRSDAVMRRRLAEVIDTFNKKKRRPYKLSCSVGISYVVPTGADALDATLSLADSAMYDEKRKKSMGPKLYAIN